MKSQNSGMNDGSVPGRSRNYAEKPHKEEYYGNKIRTAGARNAS